MIAADVIAAWRNIIAEPYQDRWSDSQALSFLSDAQRDMARELRCIEGRYGIQTIPNQGLYPLPETIAILRVYMAGPGFCQRLKPTSIPQMEGDDLRMFGDYGQNYTPRWLTLPSAPYPVQNCQFGAIGYTAGPTFPGSPPEYYLRGIGAIGMVPTPNFVYNLILDVIDLPPELQNMNDSLVFGFDFREPMMWNMAHFAYHSDQSVGADSLEAGALSNYAVSMAKRQDMLKNFNEDDPSGPLLLTHRSFFQPRQGGGQGGYWE